MDQKSFSKFGCEFLKALLLICLASATSYSQWINQYPITPGIGLGDVKFIDSKTGWACGDGIILKTTNAGANWISQVHTATNKFLANISPVNSEILYCIGFFETILKTTNGGTNWIALRNGPYGQGRSYEGAYFINKDTGWVCGSLGTILKTTNGGTTFENNPIFWGYLKDMYFINADTGLLCAAFGGMFKTTNGGANWERKTIPYWNGIGDFKKLSVVSDTIVHVCEIGRRVFRSTNFGDTWDSAGYVPPMDFPYVCGFSSYNTGWVGGSFGQLYKTTDGCSTWRRDDDGTDQRYIAAMWFQNSNTGWLVGGNTKIFHTTTGGLTSIEHYANSEIRNFELFQNYPNPFNPNTNINYELRIRNFVSLKVYDIAGREVDVLVQSHLPAGRHIVKFDGSQFTAGVYYYRITAGQESETRAMILLK